MENYSSTNISMYQPVNTIPHWEYVSKIDEYIFLGGVPYPDNITKETVTDANKSPVGHIIDLGIALVISLFDEKCKDIRWEFPPTVKHMKYYLPDNAEYQISTHFDEIADKIKQCVDAKINVFIHCHMGISRSATVLIAYFIKYGVPKPTGMIKKNPTAFEAMYYVWSKRMCINPNPGFMKQLNVYQKSLQSSEFNKAVENFWRYFANFKMR